MPIKKPQRSALGRGLSSLISSSPVPIIAPGTSTASSSLALNNGLTAQNLDLPESKGESVRFIPIDQIIANPTQPRQTFPESELAELVSSIKTLGVLQPVLVRKGSGPSQYEIVAGERRYRASKEAGIAQIPCIIKELTDKETLEIAIVENVQRQSLNPVEEGKAYNRLIEDYDLTAQEVAERVGKDRATVANMVRILKLPPAVLEMVREGRISLGHAKAILTIKEPSAQIGLAKRIESEGISVRELEGIVSRTVVLDAPVNARETKSTSRRKSKHPELEDQIRNSLGTKVLIRQGGAGKGKIEVYYYSEQELDRLVELLSKN